MPARDHRVLQDTSAWIDRQTANDAKVQHKPRAASTEHGEGLIKKRGSYPLTCLTFIHSISSSVRPCHDLWLGQAPSLVVACVVSYALRLYDNNR